MTLTFDQNTYGDLLSRLQPRVIQDETGYQAALKIAEALVANRHLSPEESAILDLFTTLIEQYEEQDLPIAEVSPHETLQHLMEARGLRQVDLVGLLGSKGVVSEVVHGKRRISVAQAKALGEFFHVSPALFI